jgi:hypothetical protein
MIKMDRRETKNALGKGLFGHPGIVFDPAADEWEPAVSFMERGMKLEGG